MIHIVAYDLKSPNSLRHSRPPCYLPCRSAFTRRPHFVFESPAVKSAQSPFLLRSSSYLRAFFWNR
jgi:hypothetical protein